MAYIYKNRKDKKYTLCAKKTKKGKTRYFFTSKPQGEIIEEIPEGYEVSENVNGQVSLRKIRPLEITPDEIALVQKAIMHHPDRKKYRVDIKDKIIRIHESTGPDFDNVMDILKDVPIPQSRIDSLLEREEDFMRYAHFLSLKLVDKKKRLFRASKIHYRHWDEMWFDISGEYSLDILVERIIPILGTDDFYRIYF